MTEQLPEDGDAKDLLAEIKAEKERLVKEGKIKKEKPLPEIREEEVPFEIPGNWCWVRLGEICTKIGSGSTPTGGKAVYVLEGIKFIRSQNVYNDGLRLDNVVFISSEMDQKKVGSRVYAKDILLNITGASIGRCALVPDDFDVANINQHVLILRLSCEKVREYVHLAMTSPYIYEEIMNVQVGRTKEGLSAAKARELMIPLPPLVEQLKIIYNVKQALVKVEELEKDEVKLNVLQKSFPRRMKNSLLQAAIQGKLIEQLKSDGDARELLAEIKKEKERLIKEGKIKKEKPLPEITADEIPFEIPDNWCWVRIGHIFTLQAGKFIASDKIKTEGRYPCYGGNGLRGYVDVYNRSGCFPLMGRQGALCGNINTAKGEFYATEHAVVVQGYCNCSADWAAYFLKALNLNQYATATAQPGLAVR